MDVSLIIWGAGVPAVVCGLLVVGGWKLWPSRSWIPPVALALAYIVAHWKLLGGPGQTNDVVVRIIYLVALSAVVGSVVDGCASRLRAGRWALAAILGAVLTIALFEPLHRISDDTALFVRIGSGTVVIFMAVYGAISHAARKDCGWLLLPTLFVLGLGSSVVLHLSTIATSAQALGIVVAGIGALLIVGWLMRSEEGAFAGLAPVIATLLVGHWVVGIGYGTMPHLTLAALAVAGIAVGIIPWVERQPWKGFAKIAVCVFAVSLPLAGAAGLAARDYFKPSSESSGNNNDYGYKP